MSRTLLKKRPAVVLHPAVEGLDDRIMPSAAVVPHHVVHIAVTHHVAKHVAHPAAKHVQAHAANHTQQAIAAARRNAILASHRVVTPAATFAAPAVTITPMTTATPDITPVAVTDPTPAATPAASTTPATSTPTTNAFPGSPPANPVPATADTPVPKAPDILNTVYKEYVAAGSPGSGFTSPEASKIEIKGNLVGVDLSYTGDLASYEAQVVALGMQIQNVDTRTGQIEGLLPIDQLPNVSQLPNPVGIAPVYNLILGPPASRFGPY